MREIERLKAERNFLLARCGHAGKCMFGGKRWTGASSNALVAIAFGGIDDALPFDGADLAACYRTILRLPAHLLSKAVLAQLVRGERYVRSKYPDDIGCARDAAEWPGISAIRARAASVDRSGEADETRSGSAEGESAVPAEERADAHPSTPES